MRKTRLVITGALAVLCIALAGCAGQSRSSDAAISTACGVILKANYDWSGYAQGDSLSDFTADREALKSSTGSVPELKGAATAMLDVVTKEIDYHSNGPTTIGELAASEDALKAAWGPVRTYCKI